MTCRLKNVSSERVGDAALVAVHLPMHTATRIALEALPRIRELAPRAQLCAYGLYAPPNEALLRERGFAAVVGGECEASLRERGVTGLREMPADMAAMFEGANGGDMLALLSDRMLDDVGLSRYDVEKESAKYFWQK